MADQAMRRSDELLSELIETIETARALPMSASCVLPRERMLDLLDELREVLPPEMDEARTVIARRDKIAQDAYETAAATRGSALSEAEAVVADARHQAEQILAVASEQADTTIHQGLEQHRRLVADTTVHQAAAHAATVLRADAERYQQQLTSEAQHYDERVRTEADHYAHAARSEAQRYATKLTADAEDYAERTLDELAAVLHRSAQTAEQGRAALAQRRAQAWVDGDGVDRAGVDTVDVDAVGDAGVPTAVRTGTFAAADVPPDAASIDDTRDERRSPLSA